MRPPHIPPSITRLSGRPRLPSANAPEAQWPHVKGRPYPEATVEAVRRLFEDTTLTYPQMAARMGVSPASISRWSQIGGWTRPLFAPRSMLTVPTPRATAYNKHRFLSRRLLALAERYVGELENASTIDLDRLAEALELAKMAKLATLRRTPRRTEAMVTGELMRPIIELCSVGVDLHRAPREAVDDFLKHRVLPPKKERPPPSRGRGNPRFLTRKQRHARMMERVE